MTRKCAMWLTAAIVWTVLLTGRTTQLASNEDPKERVLGKPSSERTNFVENFALDALNVFTRERKYVMVLFSGTGPREEKASMLFFRLSGIFEQREVFFVEVNSTEYTKEQLKEHHVESLPDLRLYVYGIPRRYSLALSQKKMTAWITQIITAGVTNINSLEDVHPVDKHYTIVVKSELYESNPAHFNVLAKLVSPTSIYTGIAEKVLRKQLLELKMVTPDNDKHDNQIPTIFAIREHDHRLLEIGEALSLHDKARFISANEFAEELECNDGSLRIAIEHKIPVLAFFHTSKTESEWPLISKIAHNYREYLLPLFINLDATGNCVQFFKEFVAVDKPSNLRILDMQGKVRRYEFIGPFTESGVKAFLENFVSGNMRSYSLNEQLTPNASYRGIKLANSHYFKHKIARLQSFCLMYVYSFDDEQFEEHISSLRIIQSVFRNNKRFSVRLFDHLRNDLDGYFHPRTPFLVFVTPTGKANYFEEAELKPEAIIKWLLRVVPYLEITEPETQAFEEL